MSGDPLDFVRGRSKSGFQKFLERGPEELVPVQVKIPKSLYEAVHREMRKEGHRLTWKALITAFLQSYLETRQRQGLGKRGKGR